MSFPPMTGAQFFPSPLAKPPPTPWAHPAEASKSWTATAPKEPEDLPACAGHVSHTCLPLWGILNRGLKLAIVADSNKRHPTLLQKGVDSTLGALSWVSYAPQGGRDGQPG